MSFPECAKKSSLEFSLLFLRINALWSSRLFRFWKELVQNRKNKGIRLWFRFNGHPETLGKAHRDSWVPRLMPAA